MRIHKLIKMAGKTTFKIGGRAQYYCEPGNEGEYKQAYEFAVSNRLTPIILGGGANVLFPDHDFNALVIATKKLNYVRISGSTVTFGAGVSVDRANKILIKSGLSGMEFSGGLPGSIGGAVYMNARCYGKEFADIVYSVTVIDPTGIMRTLSKEEIGYGYKTSIFMKEAGLFIVNATFALETAKSADIKAVYLKNLHDRIQKGQYRYPSAGCVFKNDYSVGISSGRLIDESGLKGRTLGGAQVYEQHANFIINKKHATAEDVKKLMKAVQDEVYLKKQVKLEPELRVIE